MVSQTPSCTLPTILNPVLKHAAYLSWSIFEINWARPWGYRLRKTMSKSVKKRIRKAKPMVRRYVDSQGQKRVCQT